MTPTTNRREFARRLISGGAGLGLAGASANAEEPKRPRPAPPRAPKPPEGNSPVFGTAPDMHIRTSGRLEGQFFQEDARAVPLRDEGWDVMVCGSGPAGVAAALAAARSGAKTALIEVNGCVGGVWTSGMLSWILDGKNKGGIMAEITRRAKDGAFGKFSNSKNAWDAYSYQPEHMKVVLEEMLEEAGVEIRLHTRVVGAITDDKNKLSTIITESKTGREAWTAKTFIDCTGDGDLAAQAGCEFEYGRPGDGATQPFSMMAIFTGVTTEGIAAFVRGHCEPRGLGSPKKNLLEEFRAAGVDPSYGGPTIFEIHDGLYTMMANHEYGVSAINAEDVSRASITARRENHKLINALRKKGGPWEKVEIVTTGEHIGTREARRIFGRYYMSSEDLRTGAKFDDNICDVTFPIDVHSTDKSKTKAIESKPFRSKPYQIPLRALVARDIDGLMLAGRCISGDFIAHSSYRVTGNAVVMGEAAGVTSAIAAKEGVLPQDVPFSAVSSGIV